jgi:hypothetical protein
MKTLKPKYQVNDVVILKDGQALSRFDFPKGKIEVKITKIDLEYSTIFRYRVVLARPTHTSGEYICLEDEIESNAFNPSKRNSL